MYILATVGLHWWKAARHASPPSFTVILISSQGHEGTVGIAQDSHEPHSGVSGSILHNFVISFRHVQQGLSSQEKQTPTLKGQKTGLPVYPGVFSLKKSDVWAPGNISPFLLPLGKHPLSQSPCMQFILIINLIRISVYVIFCLYTPS